MSILYPPLDAYCLITAVPVEETGATLRVEIFENDTSETPLAAGDRYYPLFLDDNGNPTVGLLEVDIMPSQTWADHDGTIRLTVLSGPLDIYHVTFSHSEPAAGGGFDVYSGAFYPTPIPEPSIGSLFLLSLIFVGLKRANHDHD